MKDKIWSGIQHKNDKFVPHRLATMPNSDSTRYSMSVLTN